MSKYLAFDIETATWPEDGDWKAAAPIGISCIGLMGTGDDEPTVFYAGTPAGPTARAMNTEELDMCMAYILDRVSLTNMKLVGWNSLQFDLQCMYLESKALGGQFTEEIKQLAMNHIDPMFQIFCTFGWPVGLDAVAHGLGLPGKMKDGVSGAAAPEMWMNGTDEDRWTVLEYVGKDAIATLDIVEVGTRTQALRWRSQKGKPYSIPYQHPKIVKECLELPVPDNSWMTKPLYREDFYSWTND